MVIVLLSFLAMSGLCSYKRVKGRIHTVEKRVAMSGLCRFLHATCMCIRVYNRVTKQYIINASSAFRHVLYKHMARHLCRLPACTLGLLKKTDVVLKEENGSFTCVENHS